MSDRPELIRIRTGRLAAALRRELTSPTVEPDPEDRPADFLFDETILVVFADVPSVRSFEARIGTAVDLLDDLRHSDDSTPILVRDWKSLRSIRRKVRTAALAAGLDLDETGRPLWNQPAA